jgi:hypothetical protein
MSHYGLYLHNSTSMLTIAGKYNIPRPEGWEDQDVKTGDFIPVYNTYDHMYHTKNGPDIEIITVGQTTGVFIDRSLLHYFKHTLGLRTKYEVYVKLNTFCAAISNDDAKGLLEFFDYPLDNDRTDKYTAFGVYQRYASRWTPFVLKIEKGFDIEKNCFIVVTAPSHPASPNSRRFGWFGTHRQVYSMERTTIILKNTDNEPTRLWSVKCVRTYGKSVTFSNQREWLELSNSTEVVRHMHWTNSSGTGAHWNEFHVIISDAESVMKRGNKVTVNSRSGNVNRYTW